MTTLREAAQQALEALKESELNYGSDAAWRDAIQVLRAALAQEEQEPIFNCPRCGHCCPQQRTLTDEIIGNLWHQNGGFHHHFARAVERWLKGGHA